MPIDQNSIIDISKAQSVGSGLSLDDNAGIFFLDTDPSVSSTGSLDKAPLGSIAIQVTGSTVNLWQKTGINDLDWSSLYSVAGTKVIPMFFSSATLNKNDYVGIGGTSSAYTGYLFPFVVTITELILLSTACSAADQDIFLIVGNGSPQFICTFPQSASSATFTINVSVPVPAGTLIKLRASTSKTGSVKNLNVNLLALSSSNI